MWIYPEYKYQTDNIVLPISTTKDPSTTINGNTIGMIIGVIFAIMILTALFVFIAYCLPWLRCYELCCWRCVSVRCFDCICCFYKCPCMEKRAYNKFVIDNLRSNRIYEQNFLTTSDGRILQTGDIRPVGNKIMQQQASPPMRGYHEAYIA